MKDKKEKALDLLKTYLMFDDEEMQVLRERITSIKEYKVHLALTAREILFDVVTCNE